MTNQKILLDLFVYFISCILQWMLQTPGATSYIGCIGKDKYGEEMKIAAKAAGVTVSS